MAKGNKGVIHIYYRLMYCLLQNLKSGVYKPHMRIYRTHLQGGYVTPTNKENI